MERGNCKSDQSHCEVTKQSHILNLQNPSYPYDLCTLKALKKNSEQKIPANQKTHRDFIFLKRNDYKLATKSFHSFNSGIPGFLFPKN